MNLPKDKQLAYDNIMEGNNVFVTGVAGTGKSFLLDYIRENSGLKLAVTATTGIAAVNVSGQTIHSYAGVGLAQGDEELVYANMTQKGIKRVRACKVLVIDEISMMSDQLFKKLDYCFRTVRQRDKPFGGVQLIVFGDFLQLPPIKKGNTAIRAGESDLENLFCFESGLWKDCNFVAVELKKVYRQNEQSFIDLLNHIRTGECSENDLKILEKCKFSPEKLPEGLKPVILTSKNARCDKINQDELNKIDKEVKISSVSVFGPEWKIKSLMRDAKIHETLEMKEGAQVMLTVNLDQPMGLVNGSMGKIVSFQNGNPVIKFDNGITREISKFEWESKEYDPDTQNLETIASVIQLPVRLAWAITIHKSQGMTIPYVYAELHDIFSEAQLYVALSRAKNLNGLFLSGFSQKKIKVNQVAKDFYDNMDKYCLTPKAKLL